MEASVLSIKQVSKQFRQHAGHQVHAVHAVRDVSFTVETGQTLAIVGESGSGKSTLGRIVACVLAPTEGTVEIQGNSVDMASKSPAQRALRLKVQLVHQDPYAAVNPTKTVQEILGGPLLEHHFVKNRRQARDRVAALLEQVSLTPVDNYLQRFSYQLSGGQRQRIVLARALSVEPGLIVADEAVSMVDVSVRLSLMKWMLDLQAARQIAYVFITHDLAIARYFSRAGSIAVMYAGRVVEYGPTQTVIGDPQHPYTAILKDAVVEPDPDHAIDSPLFPTSQDPPDLSGRQVGCSFATRCPFVEAICTTESPPLAPVAGAAAARMVACHFAGQWPQKEPKRGGLDAAEWVGAARARGGRGGS